MDLRASHLSQLSHFLFHCPFKGGYYSSVDLEMGVHIRLQEVSTHERIKCRVLVEKLPGPKFAVRLWEVSISRVFTVLTVSINL